MCLGHACNGTTFDNDFCNAQAVNTHVSRKMNARGCQYIKKTACNNIYSCFIFISQDEFHHHKTSSSSSPSKNGIGFVNKAKKTQQRLQRHKIQMEGVWKRCHTRDSHLWIVCLLIKIRHRHFKLNFQWTKKNGKCKTKCQFNHPLKSNTNKFCDETQKVV